jgi:hypothetical protein
MIFYLDNFIQRLIKAHNTVVSDQRKAVSMINEIIRELNPEDEYILECLNGCVRCGLDSPANFKKFILLAIERARKNHLSMMAGLKKVKHDK